MGANTRIAVNSLYVFIKLAISSIVSLITSRWVLSALGVEGYGIYSVVGSIVVFLNVINTAMITTTYRYVAFELGKGEAGAVNVVFNRSLIIHISLALFVFFMSEIFGVLYINNVMNIPIYRLSDAHFVLQVSTVTTMISAVTVPFQGLITAYEKFKVTTIITIQGDILKLLAIYGLTFYKGNSLRLYSLIMLIVTLIYFISYFMYSFINYRPIVRWRFSRDWNGYKDMLKFSSWILLGAASSIGKTQGAQLIINWFWGTLLNASFAVANQVNHVLQMFSNNISVAANPQITKEYSAGNIARSVDITCMISKVSAFILMLVGLPIFLETEAIFTLWLKNVPDFAVVFCKLMIIQALVDTFGAGIPALTQASGKIKVFQIVGSFWSLMSLPVACLAYKLGAPPEALNIVYIFMAILYVGIRLYILRRILEFDIKRFVTESYLRVIAVAIPIALIVFIYKRFTFLGFQVVLSLLITEMLLVSFIWYLGLNIKERDLIKRKLFQLFHKR